MNDLVTDVADVASSPRDRGHRDQAERRTRTNSQLATSFSVIYFDRYRCEKKKNLQLPSERCTCILPSNLRGHFVVLRRVNEEILEQELNRVDN